MCRRGCGFRSCVLLVRLLLAVGSVGDVAATRVVGLGLLFESAAHQVAFRGVPFQAVQCHNEPSRVVRVIAVVAVHIVWLRIGVDVVFPHFGWSPSFPVTFLFG